MLTSIILQNMSAEDIKGLFLQLQKQIEEIRANLVQPSPSTYLTRAEVADLLKCDLSTIHNWTKKGKLKPHGIGNRIYYKLTDIEEALVPIKSNNNKNK